MNLNEYFIRSLDSLANNMLLSKCYAVPVLKVRLLLLRLLSLQLHNVVLHQLTGRGLLEVQRGRGHGYTQIHLPSSLPPSTQSVQSKGRHLNAQEVGQFHATN